MKKFLSLLAVISALLVIAPSCSDIDDDRIPPYRVEVIFPTIGDWQVYGVAGAGSYQIFNAEQRVPAGFPYKGQEGTGYGGLLVIVDPMQQTLVYDLACPVCVPGKYPITLDKSADVAGIFRCDHCESTYDTYALGTPHSGPAVKYKYGLQRYRITIGGTNPYARIFR